MKPLEAWANISRRLALYENIKKFGCKNPYAKEDIEAEVICYKALKEMEERNGNQTN